MVVGRPAAAAPTATPEDSASQAPSQAPSQASASDRGAFTVATKVVADPLALEERLQQHYREESAPREADEDAVSQPPDLPSPKDHAPPDSARRDSPKSPPATSPPAMTPEAPTGSLVSKPTSSDQPSTSSADLDALTCRTFWRCNWGLGEAEELEVELTRDPQHGLGITVAGYVYRKEEIGGIFVKSLVDGSAAGADGRIRTEDLILAVNGQSLEGVSHKDAVASLVSPSSTTHLRLARFHPASPQARYLHLLRQQEADTSFVDMHSPSPPPPAKSAEERLATPPVASPDSPQAPVHDHSSLPSTSAQPQTPEAASPEAPAKSPPRAASPGPQPPVFGSPTSEAEAGSWRRAASPSPPPPPRLASPPSLRRRWGPLLGSAFDVIVSDVSLARSGDAGLGLALEGTVDVEEGAEVRPHHYIQSLSPNSPAANARPPIRPGDELLQANTVELWGRSHVEVVGGLSGLRASDTPSVRLVLGRRRAEVAEAAVYLPSEGLASASVSAAGPSGPSASSALPPFAPGQRLVKAKSEQLLVWEAAARAADSAALLSEVAHRLRSKSLEPLSGLAVWSTKGVEVVLSKGTRGLGFSVLDYQDPLHPAERIIVIRSLVPGGAAAQDGGIVPGDRLLRVNDVELCNASLESAVSALKSAPRGPVRLLVAKPLPLHQESVFQCSPLISHTERFLAKGSFATPRSKRRRRNQTDEPSAHSLERGQERSVHPQFQAYYTQAYYGSLPGSRTGSTLSGSWLSMNSWGGGSGASSASASPASASPLLLRCPQWASDVTPLPSALESHIKVAKGPLPIGVQVEGAEKGVNGVIVAGVSRNGALGKDGRVKVGDYVTRLNNENLRCVTKAQSRSILKRGNCVGASLGLSYIPSAAADEYRESLRRSPAPTDPALQPCDRLSPKSPQFGGRQEKEEGDGTSLGTSVESEWPPSVSVQLYQPQGTAAATPSDISWAAEEFSSRLASELVPGAVSEVSAASSPAGPLPDLPREPSPPAPPFDLPQPQVAPEKVDEESFPPPPPLPSTEPPLEDDELSAHSQPPLPASEDATASIAPITAATPPPSPQTSPAQTSSLLTQSSLGETPLEPPLAQAETSPSLPASTEPTAALPTLKTPSPPPDEAAQPREASSELPEPSTSSDLPVAASSEPPEGSTEPPPSSACQTSQATSSQAPEREKVEVRTSASLSMTSTTSDSITSSPNLSRGRSKYWGEPREVALVREPAKSLGISIVGGRVEVSSRGGLPGTGTTVSGIFIKSVLPNSPAGRSRHLVMGDRILSVNGTDLREATHDQAVDVIRNAANPVNFSVQSLHSFPPSNEPGASGGNSAASSTPGTPSMPRGSTKTDRPPLTPPRSPSPEGHEAQGEHNEASTPPATQATVEEAAAEETASTPLTQEPSPAPPSAPSAQPSVDSWSEEASSRYGDIGGELVRVNLDRRPVPGKEELEGLGLSLAGNKDRSKTSVFVVGVAPNSPAARSENITQGDELLEHLDVVAQINGVLLYGRSHLNASGLIRGVAEAAVELVMRRRGAEALREMAVKPQGPPLPTKPTAKHPSPTRPQPTNATQPADATTESPVREMGKESSNPDVSPESSTADSAEPREVLVTRGPAGFGITLTEGTTTDLLKGIFVTNISPNSSTGGCAGELKVGDQVVAVNGQAVSEASSSQVAALMQKSPSNRVRLTVATHTIVPLPDDRRDPAHPDVRKEAVKKDSLKSRKSRDSTTPTTTASDMKKELTPPAIAEAAETDKAQETEPAQTTQVKVTASTPEAEAEAPEAKTEPAPAPPVVESDPSSVEILPGQETLMEIEKGGKGLGLSIVGGSDTVLGSVVIHEVYPDGAAAKDGRLAPGDQVLEVNGESLREISHDAAIALLRQTPAKVRLLVYRDLNLQLSLLDPSQIYNIFTIDLMKKPGRGLGLSIVGRKGEAGVFVSEVVKGGVAEADGRLLQGDQILAVNGQNLTSATQETAAAILKTCLGKVVLKIGRWKLSEGAKPGVPLFPAPKTPTLAGADGMPVAASAPVLLKETPAPAPKAAPTPAPKPEPAPTPKIEPVKPPTPPKAEEAKAPEVSSPPPLNNGAVTTTVPPSEAAAVPPSVPEKLGEATTSSGAPELIGTLSEENSESLLVLLEKGEGRTLGMGIGKRARGILVTSLQPESVAATKLRVGDRLMAVNGVPVTDQSSAVTAVKASGPKLYLQIARPLAELQNKTGVAKEIALSRGEEGLGFSVVGGTGSTHGDLPILIKSVFSRGAAAKDGRIKRGDQILAVNGESLLGVPHDQAVQLLKEVRGEVVLTILPAPDDLPAAPSSAPTIPSAKSS